MTSAQLQQYLDDAAAAADVALPLLGEGEFVPVVTALDVLVQKIVAAVAAKSGDATVAAAMAAARASADLAESVKFGAAK